MTKHISREELKAKMDRGEDFILIDTLPAAAFEKGHLPGAIHIVSDNIIAEAPRRIPDKDTEIVVYCANTACKRSEKSAERLESLGYTNVTDYVEGKADWSDGGLPLEVGSD